jgi:hypothetical protein
MEENLLKAAEESEDRALAMCMALHSRLGQASIASCLDENLLLMVSEHLCSPKSRRALAALSQLACIKMHTKD